MSGPGKSLVCLLDLLFGNSFFFYVIPNPLSSLTYGKGTGKMAPGLPINLHGNRHGKKHAVFFPAKGCPDLPWSSLHKYAAFIHHKNAVCVGDNILKPVFRQQDCGPNIPVYFLYCFQKIRSCNGIQLGGRFVQDQ